jgi:pyruvate formate lyase activating enzyme
MLIGGLQKFTTLDYPGKIAATVFTVGCNFHCPFCHNGEIVEMGGGNRLLDEEEVLAFLASRQGELDGVCISGGEPTLQADLALFIEKIKRLGYEVKLDTNGFNTEVVKRIVEDDLVDYFAIDIKTSFSKYHLVNAPLSALERVLETVHLIIRRGKKLELRTTVVPEIVESGDFERIIEDLNEKSAEILANVVRYSVQAFRPQKCLDKYFEGVKPYEDEVLEEIALKLRKHVNKVDILK